MRVVINFLNLNMYENFDYGDEDYGGAIETHGDLAGFEMLEEEMDEDYEPT